MGQGGDQSPGDPLKLSMSYLLLSLLLLPTSDAVLNMGNPDAKRLYDDLLSNYNKLVRPVQNTTDPLTVRIKLKLSQLIDVVSSSQSTDTRILTTWTLMKNVDLTTKALEAVISVHSSPDLLIRTFVPLTFCKYQALCHQ